MGKLVMTPLVFSLFSGCGSETKEQPVAKKEEKPRPDHLLEDVQKAPTYGDKMLKTYQGAKEVKKQIDQQTAEQKDTLKDAD